jgi:hypothetical protein
MSKKLAEEFSAKYRPIAEQVGKEIGVDPNIILSQWALESAYGKKIPASNNIAGIQDFSGKGKAAKDPQTGKTGKYVEFEDPETFGMYYADMIKRQFPHVVNTGEDLGAFTRGLVAGRSGSYFEAKPQGYATGLASFYNTLPGVERLEAPDVTQFVQQAQSGEQNLVTVPPPSTEVDSSGADEGSRFFLGGAGAALGTAASGLGAAMDKREERLIRQTALQERAKLNEQKVAREQERIAREARFAAAETAAKAAAAKGAATGPLSLMPTLDQQTRIQQGTTGDLGTTGRARSTGFNTETSQLSAAEKQARANAQALKNMGIVTQDAPEFFSRQSAMTSSPSGVLIPRAEPAQTLGPRPSPPLSFPRADPTGPRGTVFSRPPTPIPDLFTVSPDYVPPAPPPTTGQKIKSGLDLVTDKFNRMMRPVAGAVATGARYVLPPVAGLSAGLDIAEASHEYSKPENQRDYKTIGLRGASALGGALSMIPTPATMAVGTGLSLGASGLQAYREDPEIFRKLRRRIFSSDNPEQMVAP